MAREHARVKLSIWEDDDYRDLTVAAQHLYQVLLIHPKLDYCGVTEWRPSKLSGFASGWTSSDVELAAKELADRLYIVIDEQTEEVLIRSFIRNDELLDSPNMATAVRKAHMGIASRTLRGVVVHELVRLHDDKPDLKGWKNVNDLLTKGSVNPSGIPSWNPSLSPSENPSRKGSGNPSGKGSGNPEPIPSENPSGIPSPTTAPAPAPNSSSPQKTSSSSDGRAARRGDHDETSNRGTRIDPSWTPSSALVEWQRTEGISDELARRELPRFRDYWDSQAGAKGVKRNWDATWRNWLRREHDRAAQSPKPSSGRSASWEFGQ